MRAKVTAGQLTVSLPNGIAGFVTVELVKARSPQRKPRRGDTDEDFAVGYKAANRNVVVSSSVVDTLESMKPKFPKPEFDISKITVE